MNYTNARLLAVIPGWPYGQLRTTAAFAVERHSTRGQRVARTTINPKTGAVSASKRTTYAVRCAIVDGDDGRTYIASLTDYGHIGIMRSDMQISHEAIFDSDPRYAALLAAIELAA